VELVRSTQVAQVVHGFNFIRSRPSRIICRAVDVHIRDSTVSTPSTAPCSAKWLLFGYFRAIQTLELRVDEGSGARGKSGHLSKSMGNI